MNEVNGINYKKLVDDLYEAYLMGKYDGTKKQFKEFIENLGLGEYYED